MQTHFKIGRAPRSPLLPAYRRIDEIRANRIPRLPAPAQQVAEEAPTTALLRRTANAALWASVGLGFALLLINVAKNIS